MTKAEDQRPKNKNQMIWLFFALVIVAVYFFALGSFPLVGPDEARYAQVAREMFERGDWMTPTLGGFNWFEKPVLLYWLQIISYKLFGVSEFAARFGSALFGLGTLFSLWMLGRNLATERTENFEKENKNFAETSVSSWTKNFANWLALISASSIGLLVFSRGASFDIILTFPITASLVSFFIWDTRDRKSQIANRKYLIAFYFFIGVALLAKGLVGIVFPFAIVAFYYLLSLKFPGKTFILSLFWGTVLSLLIASIWYLPMYQTHGWTFIDEFFIQHHFARYTSNKYQHPQPFYFFFWVLPLMTLPWLPFFLASIWKVVRSPRSAVRKNVEIRLSSLTTFTLESVEVRRSSLTTFALAWLLVPLVFFSFSGSKLPGYILPSLPAALILTAASVFGFVLKNENRKIALQILAFMTFAVTVFLLQFYMPKFADADSVKNLIESANSKGCGSEKITNLFVVSHNAEFYAAGRLVRDIDGKLKRYDDFLVLVNEMKAENTRQMLVLMPHRSEAEVLESPLVESELLADNGSTAIILVKLK